MELRFYEEARDAELELAVTAARYGNRWLLCRHKDRQTWELPGGHREEGESVLAAAKRELWEETGATGMQVEPVAAFMIAEGETTTWGGLFFADIWELGERPADSEIAENGCFERLPSRVTYPDFTPALFAQAEHWLAGGNFRSELDDLMEMLL